MKLYYLAVGLILCATSVRAQVGQGLRVEISIDELADEFVVAPVGEYGLVVFGETDAAPKEGMTRWRFIQYGTDFEQLGARSVNIEKRYESKGHFFADSVLYVLFTDIGRSDEYKLVRVNVADFGTRSVTGPMPKSLQIRDFVIHDDYLYVSGATGNRDAIAMANLRNRVLKLEPITYPGTNSVQSIDITSGGLVSYTISNYRRNNGLIYIQSYASGKRVDEIRVVPRGDNNLLSARITEIGDGVRIIAGTYSERRQYGTGMYLARIDDGEQSFITYHHFADFNNFFAYLPRKKQARIERKKERKEEKGKDLSLNYQLLTHDMIRQGDTYLLIAEAYYETYRNVQRWETVYAYGRYRRVLRQRRVFDGYQYSHGIVAAFDTSGALLWDNTFEMNDFKSFELKERIQVHVSDDEIEMAYGVEDHIRTKVIRGNQVVDHKQGARIATGQRGDQVKRSTLTNLEYWYDEYFVVWGFQKIKATDTQDGARKRKVFYFQKMRVL
ncbi:MAG: hypothetical protein R3301_12630 [Saprospiraceae bacterium]|nr:hypothetical protein [Saprospiraceae bacterium]